MPAGEIKQRIDAIAGYEKHGAAVAPVAAVGPAFGDELLAAEADAAIAAPPGADLDADFVDKQPVGPPRMRHAP
jgi:hypothetical protein